MSQDIPTSPTMPAKDIVTNPKDFSDAMTLDLTDEEIKEAMAIVVKVRARYIDKWQFMSFDSVDHAVDELDKFRDEISTVMAEKLGLLVTVDGSPILTGESPIIEFIGKIEGTQFAKHGMDHERKEFEVKLATKRNEDYLGQKGK